MTSAGTQPCCRDVGGAGRVAPPTMGSCTAVTLKVPWPRVVTHKTVFQEPVIALCPAPPGRAQVRHPLTLAELRRGH